MVRVARCLTFTGSLALLLTSVLSARELSEYRVGDTVEADIIASVPLQVVDPEGTAALRQKEALRVPAIFLFDPTAADMVEGTVRAAFDRTRKDFLRRVEQRFHTPRLEDAAMASRKFQGLVSDFLEPRKPLPISTNLAAMWARGETGSDIESNIVARLRTAMERPIRPDFLPAGFKLGYQERLVTMTNRDQVLSLDEAEQRGIPTARTNMVALSRARKDLQATFPPEEHALARFAARALRPNCFPEAELTQQARTRYTNPLFAADHFDVGQVVAAQGQVVNAKIKGAIDQLLEKTAVAHLQRRVGEEQATAVRIRQRDQWLWTGLMVVTLVLISVSWRLARRRKAVSLLPARMSSDGSKVATIACPSCDETIVIPVHALNASVNTDNWQKRALAAEQRAERAHAAIRAGVMSQFALWLRHRFVGGLVTERARMIEAQKSATAELAELERRLDELHAPLQERLRAYEKRIAELEKSLAARGEENRELLRAKIQMTRQQLENARARSPVEFN